MTEEAPTIRNEAPSVVPELRLKGELPRVTRLSRKVILVLGGVSCLILGGALIYALQGRDRTAESTELYSTENQRTADGLADLPDDYSQVPKLGPALPGDLGRPILASQNEGTAPAMPMPGANPVEQRRVQETEAARISGLFTDTTARNPSAILPSPEPVPTPDLATLGLTPQIMNPTDTDRQLAFVNDAVDRRTVSPDRLQPAASPFVVQAGTVIPAALITGIRSDLPGQITAQVTEHVYDTPTGQHLLIPQGARLIGEYDSQVAFGQRRVLLVWTRLVLPDGKSIVLERLSGADAAGFSGLEDQVDYHWGELFKAAALSTLLSVGTQTGSSSDESALLEALRTGAADSINQAGQQVLQRSSSIQPTLTIRPGFPVRIIVNHDIVLSPWKG